MTDRIALLITKNKLQAAIKITPPIDKETLKTQQVVAYLNSKGVGFGISEVNIQKILDQKIYNSPVIIAQGQELEEGSAAQLKLFFSQKPTPRPKLRENGKMDFKNLGYIENVKAEQVIAEIIPARPGIIGRTVTNELTMPKKIPDLKYNLGENVKKIKNYIMATTEGTPAYINNTISVLTAYDIDGNINFSTGNINFVGDLNIHGNVQSGFEVKAGGNLIIDGFVEQAIICTDKNLLVKKGITTQKKGKIQCQQNITAGFIENSIIECLGSLEVDTDIMHSIINCGESITVGKPHTKGLICGGKIKAQYAITATEAGSHMATNTILEVGSTPNFTETNPDSVKTQLINERMIQITNTIQDLLLEQKKLMHNNITPTAEQIEKADNFSLRIETLEQELINLTTKKQQLEKKINQKSPNSDAIITIKGIVHVGVQIIINQAHLIIDEPLKQVTFFEINGKINIKNLITI